MPTTSPRRTVKLTSAKSSPERSADLERHRRVGGHGPAAASATPKFTCSPVIASISVSFGRSPTGAETMWRASRSTVTAWQIS